MRWRYDWTAGAALLLVAASGRLWAQPAAPAPAAPGRVIALPDADRRALEKYLGTDTIGKPVPAPVIDDPAAWYGLKAGTWMGRTHHGKPYRRVLAARESDKYGTNWVCRAGTEKVFYLRGTADGHAIESPSTINFEHAVVSRFSPAEPQAIAGMKPGAQEVMVLHVKVYDLSHPTDLEHKGALTLTLSYLGAYHVTVPAGAYDAVLLKWHYRGHIGPASIEDSVYRFYAKDVGPVAIVEFDNVSAFPIYSDHSKTGVVLTGFEAAAAP
jgi:hypothetical protein